MILLIFEKHWNILVLPVNVSLLCMKLSKLIIKKIILL